MAHRPAEDIDAEVAHLRAALVEAAECLRLIDTDPRVSVDSEALRTRVHQARIQSHAACYATQNAGISG